MKKYLLISIILFITFNGFSQIEGNTKAKLYFYEAQKLFNQNDYKDALSYIAKTETTLGSTNGRILNLKIKTLYNMGKFIEAEKALSLFSKSFENDVTEEMKSDTYAYFVRIEKAASAQKNKITKEEARKQELLSKADFNVRRTPDGTGLIKENGSIGLIDKSGNIIVPIKYLKISEGNSKIISMKTHDSKFDLYKGNKLLLSGFTLYISFNKNNDYIVMPKMKDKHKTAKNFYQIGVYNAKENSWVVPLGKYPDIEWDTGGVKVFKLHKNGRYLESVGRFVRF